MIEFSKRIVALHLFDSRRNSQARGFFLNAVLDYSNSHQMIRRLLLRNEKKVKLF